MWKPMFQMSKFLISLPMEIVSMAGLYASIPLKKGVMSTSTRGSFAHLYEEGNDQYSDWPKSYDYLLRYDLRDTNSNPLSVTLMGAGDTYTRALRDTERLNSFEQTQIQILPLIVIFQYCPSKQEGRHLVFP